MEEWPFVEELSRPLHEPLVLSGSPPAANEIDLRNGICLNNSFPDPAGLLTTALEDFDDFTRSLGCPPAGEKNLVLAKDSHLQKEAWRRTVHQDSIMLEAADTEGIRRGLIAMEDSILARNSLCLPEGVTEKQSIIQTRLSRCFYGPINRPPLCRDELLDEFDYYPDGYLNRMAHHGINGLWLTIRFTDLLDSTVLPELGVDPGAPARLAKLRRIVRQCARFGIKMYPFCIEPAALAADSAVIAAHPELAGAPISGNRFLFCTGSPAGKAYLEEAGRKLFSAVPGLGGILCIPVGERYTHCVSARIPTTCPKCSLKSAESVLADTLAALAGGMKSVDPEAQLIAWPYGQLVVWGAADTVKAAGHMPPGVALQHNFETGGRVKQLGKWRPLWDYWLSWPGPCRIFEDCAAATAANGTPMFAKLQTSCSHEVATTQFVPAPGLIYRKYKRMHELGVSGVTMGWYFGNYPSLMTRAAGNLAFAPLPPNETEFLRELAASQWGRHTETVVRAWQHFTEGYSNFPGSQRFSYYSPMHDGLIWPLYLKPRFLPLPPTWRNVHPISGDHIADCIAPEFTCEEIITLCRIMRDHWRKGLKALQPVRRDKNLSTENLRELEVAEALGLQFESAHAILLFYALRDRLAHSRPGAARSATLQRMRLIVLEEMQRSTEMLKLCRKNRTLGFHSEAEGYKYFPAAITQRIKQLKKLLTDEFSEIMSDIDSAVLPGFEDYVGRGDSVLAFTCTMGAENMAEDPFDPAWDKTPFVECLNWASPDEAEADKPFPFQSTLYPLAARERPCPSALSWKAVWTASSIIFCLKWRREYNAELAASVTDNDELRVTLETTRIGPSRTFIAPKNRDGAMVCGELRLKTSRAASNKEERMSFSLPLDMLGIPERAGRKKPPALRAQVGCFFSPILDPLCFDGKPLLHSWAPMRRTLPRNLHGYIDPSAFGWLKFRQK